MEGGSKMKSAAYECEVYHERLAPKRHKFSYSLFFLDLELKEIPKLTRKLLLFSHNRFNIFAYRDKDHLDLGEPCLRSNLEKWLHTQGVSIDPEWSIRLLTLPRIVGYIFNPVCFYFISTSDGVPVYSVVEVCNTFREIKPWLIEATKDSGSFRRRVPKHFYVSPFTNLTTQFEFRLKVPQDKLEIHINDIENGQTQLVSWIKGRRRSLTNFRLLWYSVRYPALTLQVILKIHWQAFRLWLKRLPYHKKDSDTQLQQGIFNPHSSLANRTDS